jgi:threonine dehydratase
VLAAFEVPEPDLPALRGFLERLGYPFLEESENAAYELFLSAAAPG